MTDESMTRCPPYYVVPGLTLDSGEPVTFVNIMHAMDEFWNHSVANVVKYCLRCGRKPGADYAKDIRKALWCCVSELERIGVRVRVEIE